MRSLYTILLLAVSLILSAQQANEIYIAVMNLDPKGVSQIESEALSDRLRTELFNSGKYKVVERENMNTIMNEQGFQQTGCTSEDCAVEIGKILGVEQMLVGSIAKVGAVITVSARIVSVETGEVLKIAETDHKGSIDDLLKSGMKKIAMELVVGGKKSMLMGKVTFESDQPLMVVIDGKEVDEAPFYEYLITSGAHKVEYKSKYGQILKDQIVSISADKTTLVDLKRNSRTMTMVKSLLPGFGQFSTERPVAGTLYALGTTLCVGAVTFSFLDNSKKIDDYNKAVDSYKVLPASTGISTKKQKLSEINDLKSKADDSYDLYLYSMGAAVGIYAINILDALLFTPDLKIDIIAQNKVEIKPSFTFDGNKIKTGFYFNF